MDNNVKRLVLVGLISSATTLAVCAVGFYIWNRQFSGLTTRRKSVERKNGRDSPEQLSLTTRRKSVERKNGRDSPEQLNSGDLVDLGDLDVDVPEDSGDNDLTEEVLDAIILHANNDYEEAQECKRLLLSNIQNIQVDLVEELSLPGESILNVLTCLFDRHRLIIVYITENFNRDGVIVHGKHISLIQALTDTQKNDRVVPMLVGTTEICDDLIPITPVKYIPNGTSFEVDRFVKKMEQLFKHWKKRIPGNNH